MQPWNFDGILHQLRHCILHTVFTRRSVLKGTLRRDQKVIFVKSPISCLNPIPTRGGAHCAPQVHFLKYLRNALSYGLETFWQFKWIKLKNKNLVFNRLRPPLVTIATFKVDACFWKAHFGSFHAKAYQNSMFFATPMKTGRTVVCCENLG